jgi:hypothetical protein
MDVLPVFDHLRDLAAKPTLAGLLLREKSTAQTPARDGEERITL